MQLLIMSGSAPRDRETRGQWYERRIRLEREEREAAIQARKAAEAAARQHEVGPPLDERFLQRRSPRVSDQADRLRSYRREIFEMDAPPTLSHPGDGESVELRATLTPPPTYGSPLTNAQDAQSTIHALHSQLEVERRRYAELQQLQEHAKRQMRRYTAEPKAVQELQGDAVMADDDGQLARLELRAERMKPLWDDSKVEVARLEEELARKDKVIEELRLEIQSWMEVAQRQEGQRQNAQGHDTSSNVSKDVGIATKVKSTRRSKSKPWLSKNKNGIKFIRGDDVYDLSGPLAPLCTWTKRVAEAVLWVFVRLLARSRLIG